MSSTHDDDTCPHLVRASLLEAENARLKAKVERLTEAGDDLWAFAHNCVERGVYTGPAQKRIDAWNAALINPPAIFP